MPDREELVDWEENTSGGGQEEEAKEQVQDIEDPVNIRFVLRNKNKKHRILLLLNTSKETIWEKTTTTRTRTARGKDKKETSTRTICIRHLNSTTSKGRVKKEEWNFPLNPSLNQIFPIMRPSLTRMTPRPGKHL